jgi:AAA+ ATPase superfamily predicted ATPase
LNIIGRKDEQRELQRYYDSGRPEFVVVYGRRRVGKTFLVREFFKDQLTFSFTGTVAAKRTDMLSDFDRAIVKQGGEAKTASRNWHDAFDKLESLLTGRGPGRKVVFIDEMPWLDTRNSDFLTALDYHWNSWASSNPDILLIACGSSTSWIVKKLFKNRKGLHNRVTGRIHLAPFTLGECEDYFKDRRIEISRYQMLESWMIFGGIPYYLDYFDGSRSFSQNVDRICFAEDAYLADEYSELYRSLFDSPERHLKVVEALARTKKGLTRDEISKAVKLPPNGHLTMTLEQLKQCDFIDRYNDFTKENNGAIYYLKDPFTLFFLRFMSNSNSKDEYFWTNYLEDGGHRAWSGFSFEMVCRGHLRQIKRGLGIAGVSTSAASWRSRSAKPGAQIDLVIKRADGVINLCEMKYTKHPYRVDASEAEALERKKAAFIGETGTNHALHITFVTTYGLERRGYFGTVQSELTMSDLFEG